MLGLFLALCFRICASYRHFTVTDTSLIIYTCQKGERRLEGDPQCRLGQKSRGEYLALELQNDRDQAERFNILILHIDCIVKRWE
jgi:hypothetical protein